SIPLQNTTSCRNLPSLSRLGFRGFAGSNPAVPTHPTRGSLSSFETSRFCVSSIDLWQRHQRNLIFMRIVRALCLASVGAAVLLARVAGAQDTREVVLRLHRAGDTVSIRGATVTIDHTIDAGTTDSAGIVRIPDLEDGGHIIEVVARGYQAYFDNFVTGANVRQ